MTEMDKSESGVVCGIANPGKFYKYVEQATLHLSARSSVNALSGFAGHGDAPIAAIRACSDLRGRRLEHHLNSFPSSSIVFWTKVAATA
jgi:hypothetical protein